MQQLLHVIMSDEARERYLCNNMLHGSHPRRMREGRTPQHSVNKLRNQIAGDGEGSMGQRWLVFIPQLPSSPSSLRVLVWRRMRAAGAAALQQGVWVLPQTPEHEQFLRDVLLEAQQQGGSGILMVATPLDADQASEVVERFRADRDQEYHEFGVQCRDFLAEIAKETDGTQFDVCGAGRE